jgi:hypothetical protein
VQSIFPIEGLTAGGATARITGTGFQPGATVSVDGSRVAATVLSDTTISLAMPAHGVGKVEVTVGQGSQVAVVPRGFTYVSVLGPRPVISELLPNIGSTRGSTPMTIRGTGFHSNLTVTVAGVQTNNQYFGDSTQARIITPPHAAGTVEVIVANPDGQAASMTFMYAPPATLDFNGDWQGIASDWDGEVFGAFALTIRDNIVVSVSCRGATLTPEPPPVVTNGQFRFVASGGGSIEGEIFSPIFASGYITLGSCASSPYWHAEKK